MRVESDSGVVECIRSRFRACLAVQAAVVLSRSSLKLDFRSPCLLLHRGRTDSLQGTYMNAYRALALMHAGRTDSIHRLFVGSSCFSSLDFCVADGFMPVSGTHLHAVDVCGFSSRRG
jgi:hypothetical protein